MMHSQDANRYVWVSELDVKGAMIRPAVWARPEDWRLVGNMMRQGQL